MIIPGSGRQCKFWSTPWSPFGQLITFLGNTGPRAIGIPLSTSLGSLWNGKSWTLPPARSNIMKLVMTFLITISLTRTPDAAIWNTTGFDPVQNQKFSARKVYNLIRESKPIVPWKNTVWLKKVWGTIARNLNLVLQSNSWNATLESLSNMSGDRHLHRQVYRSSSAIISSISTIIKNRISSLREDNGGFSSTAMQLWLSSS
ncbi:hypothetical protein F2Q69_00027482 [Brassica cretica]|uniref:Reverse transcriptase zinc-binding domain-containing protein n=1 Tax=Brassica cretica TaxID=69181 RepID=A0A8S9S2B4_BRACR|nr:hypothetical protein F2Q69_00027482 [Brassica cretica]